MRATDSAAWGRVLLGVGLLWAGAAGAIETPTESSSNRRPGESTSSMPPQVASRPPLSSATMSFVPASMEECLHRALARWERLCRASSSERPWNARFWPRLGLRGGGRGGSSREEVRWLGRQSWGVAVTLSWPLATQALTAGMMAGAEDSCARRRAFLRQRIPRLWQARTALSQGGPGDEDEARLGWLRRAELDGELAVLIGAAGDAP